MPILLSLPGRNTDEPWHRTIMSRTQTTDLLVGFPHHCTRRARRRRVRFSDRMEIVVFTPHCESHNVFRHELWYNETQYQQMKFAAKREKRLALLREHHRSSVDIARNQFKTLADEHGQDVLLSIEPNMPNIITPTYSVQKATDTYTRMNRVGIEHHDSNIA